MNVISPNTNQSEEKTKEDRSENQPCESQSLRDRSEKEFVLNMAGTKRHYYDLMMQKNLIVRREWRTNVVSACKKIITRDFKWKCSEKQHDLVNIVNSKKKSVTRVFVLYFWFYFNNMIFEYETGEHLINTVWFSVLWSGFRIQNYSYLVGFGSRICCSIFLFMNFLLVFGSAHWEWGHLVNPPLCLTLLPFSGPVAVCAVTLALSELQRRYTQYECGRMQPLLWSTGI